MKVFKKICKAMILPHVSVLFITVPVAIVLLVCSLTVFDPESIATYASYALSAYALTLVCVRIPGTIKFIKHLKNDNKYVVRYTSDAQLRVQISLCAALLFNFAYAIFQLGLGIFHGSFWFYSLALYYALLVIIRGSLLLKVRGMKASENQLAEFIRYRFCGIILLTMTLALTAMVFFMTYFGRGFTHHYITTIALAAYTFTSMTFAIINVVKYRKFESPVLSASRAISLAAAAVSMLTLETAMFSAFGTSEDTETQGMMTLLTGIAVCVFVATMAISMIIHSTKKIKKLRSEAN